MNSAPSAMPAGPGRWDRRFEVLIWPRWPTLPSPVTSRRSRGQVGRNGWKIMSTVSDLADVRDDVVSWRAGDWELACVPKQGGRLLRCDWQGEVIMRRATSDSIWDAAHFPLVPFSNRIAQGHFEIGNRVVTLRPNMPGSDSLHPLHGQGWQSPWTLELMDEGGLELGLAVSAGEWPWAYAARQSFRLHERDLVMTLSLTNEAV